MSEYRKQAKILQAMAHPARLQILEILARAPACVCDLIGQTRGRQANVSQHLMLLRRVRLVKATRQGKNVQYELARPDHINNMLKCIFGDSQAKIPHEGETKMSATTNNGVWHGIPREEIDWSPTIVTDRCVGCGLCATSCGRGVYAFDYETNRPVVAAPQMCMVGCTTCATICTQDAIEFPSQGYIRQIIKKNKLLTQSKNMLRANREKYEIGPRQPAAA